MITEEHAKPPPIAVPSQVNHSSKFIYFQHVTQEEQGRAQSSERRSLALAGGHPDDESDHRHRSAPRHLRARPHHRRQERACEPEGDAADIDRRLALTGSHCYELKGVLPGLTLGEHRLTKSSLDEVTRQDQLDLSPASLPRRTHRSREVANLFDEALDDRAHSSIFQRRDDHGPWTGR
jgi:hypothetical protein